MPQCPECGRELSCLHCRGKEYAARARRKYGIRKLRQWGKRGGRPRGKFRIRPRSAEAEEQHESGLIALFEKKGDQPILNGPRKGNPEPKIVHPGWPPLPE